MTELSPESRALLGVARDERPTADDRARVRARVLAAMAGGAAPGAASSPKPAVRAPATVLGMAVGSKLLLGGVAALSFAAGALFTAAMPRAPRVVIERRVVERVVPGPVVTVTLPAPSTAVTPTIPPAVIAPPRAVSARRVASAGPATSTLDAELDALRTIDRLLAEGDLDGGLAAIGEYRATYRRGQLLRDVAEREVVALCRAGRADEARARARGVGPGSAAWRAVERGCPTAP